jgi:hypothetical protein
LAVAAAEAWAHELFGAAKPTLRNAITAIQGYRFTFVSSAKTQEASIACIPDRACQD